MTRRVPAQLAGVLVTGLVTVLVAGLLGGCGGDPFEDYCGRVEEHQVALTEAVADGGPESLLGVLPELQDLRGAAPRDIADEWQQVVGRVEALGEVLDDADVDPAAYDREALPEGLDEQDRAAIDGAARELVRPTTLDALAAIETEVRDVCGTPLYQ